MGRNYFTTLSWFRLLVACAALVLCSQSQACVAKGCARNLWELGASISGVPAILVYGIAVQESGVGAGKKRRPHPWTLNSAAGPMYFSSRAAAEIALVELLKKYTNVDIGTMQVNWGANGRYFVDDARELLDPKVNIIVAALVLKDAVAASNGNLDAGIGRYHRWKLNDEARNYASKVFRNAGQGVR
ncbi:transglycosylase SLT domain-containing protein [Duganella vulcania]|uniref:Transglycosylase SLT domain-containing protein n=1 Tax=Duganella vulcania TaxID=2692166 RepID=A0A845GDM5_9BURK|nr:transglycosylase SLT domain-containing protein [Duganella vulcania]MYM92723.1 transglycosylase SLT domain-containing protein [Duganella vulcania]